MYERGVRRNLRAPLFVSEEDAEPRTSMPRTSMRVARLPGGPMADNERPDEPRNVHLSNRERRRRDRTIWRLAFLLSAIAHVLILLIGPPAGLPDSPFSAAGPRAQDDEAAEGALQAVSLSSAPPDAAIPPPTPVPDVEIPPPEELEIEPEAEPEVEVVEPDLPDPGVGATTGDDPQDQGDAGLPEATGQGDGGTAEEGLFRVIPPSPRAVFLPPTPTSEARGSEVEIWVFVDAEGRVVPDSTRLEPATPDAKYNEEFIERASNWAFRPARRGEELIATWWSWRVEL